MAESANDAMNTANQSNDRANAAVANARGLLSDFEDVSVEVKHGAIQHAMDELRNAKRALPEDY